MSEQASTRVVISHNWSGDHTPYRNTMRDPVTDQRVGWLELLGDLLGLVEVSIGGVLRRVDDGDEVEITIRPTGRRPFGDRRIVLVKPHTYEREP